MNGIASESSSRHGTRPTGELTSSHPAPFVARHACLGPALLFALLGMACIAPPVVIEVRSVDCALLLGEFPPGTETIEIAGPTGPLRGFFVPAGEDAPVVVHLLGSGGSVAAPYGTPSTAACALSGLGFASLMVDYTGVGASPGERHVDNLARDARAMWDAALARVGGDANRVHVRATSIGTLATAELLVSGIRPASLVLVAPVMPGSAVARGAATLYGDPAGLLAELLYRPITHASLTDVLPHAPPTIVFQPAEETFAWDREIAALRIATERGGGTWRLIRGQHMFVSAFANQMLPGEEHWWIRHACPKQQARDLWTLMGELEDAAIARIAADQDAFRRLQEMAGFVRLRAAKDVAAAALALDDQSLAVLTLCIDWRRAADLDLVETVDAFRSAAPGRPLDMLDLFLSAPLRTMRMSGGPAREDPATWWEYAEAVRRGEPLRLVRVIAADTATMTFRPTDTRSAEAAPIARVDEVRRTAQVLMRSAGLACRASEDDEGNWRLEMWCEGTWQEVGPP